MKETETTKYNSMSLETYLVQLSYFKQNIKIKVLFSRNRCKFGKLYAKILANFELGNAFKFYHEKAVSKQLRYFKNFSGDLIVHTF
jgi:hypothetical protein